jgi:hypothetical protein
MQNEPTTEEVDMPVVTPQVVEPEVVSLPVTDKTLKPEGRHFLAVFFFSFFWGTFGVDRFYLGKIPTGILKLITFGGFGIWTLIDLALIMTGAMTDKQGRPMLEFQRYKKLASRTVLWFVILTALTLLFSGISAIITITDLINKYQSGGGGTAGITSALKGMVPASALQSLGLN